jgi:two-component system, NarL family, sensor kinase
MMNFNPLSRSALVDFAFAKLVSPLKLRRYADGEARLCLCIADSAKQGGKVWFKSQGQVPETRTRGLSWGLIPFIRKKYYIIILFTYFINIPGHLKAQVEFNQIEYNLNDLDKEIVHLPDNVKASVYLQCYDFFREKDIEKAQKYNQKAFDILQSTEQFFKLATCYFNFGSINKIHGDYSEAEENFNKSIALFQKVNNKIGLSECYDNLGSVYRNKSEIDLAMQYYTKAYNIAVEAGYETGIINTTSNIGFIYLRQGYYDKAIVSFEKSLSLSKYEDYATLNNLGTAYKELKDYHKALKYYQKSLKVAEKEGNLSYTVIPMGNIGVIYLEQEEFDQALTYFKKSQQIEEKLELKKGLMATYADIGLVYRMQKKYDSALVYFEKAENIAIENSDKYALKKIYISVALTHEEAGNYIRAIDYLYDLNTLNKEIFDIEKSAKIEELLAKYETEKKEKELIILKKDKELKETELAKNKMKLESQKLLRELETKENENKIAMLNKQNELQALSLQKNKIEKEKKEEEILNLTKEGELQEIQFQKEQAELKQRNLLKNIAIIIAVILILAAIVLIILYQQKIKTVELLNLKIEEVNKQKIYKLLRDQEFSAIQANIEGQEKERKRVAQDLHDGIGGNLASIKLQLANIVKDTGNKKLSEVMKNIDDTYNEVRTISHNLVPAKIMDHAYIGIIENFINEIMKSKLIDVNFTFFPENELNILPNEIKVEIYRVIQELMSNIIKYAKAKNVDIQLIKRDGLVNLMVEDNGIGLDASKLTHGIGLNNIRSRINALNGELNIESAIGQWTLVNIEIPV